MPDEAPEREGSRSRELRELRESVRTEGVLWGWGADGGLIPWEDRQGRLTLVFWRSAERASEENADEDAGPGEGPVAHPVAVLLEKLGSWVEKGVAVFGLESRGGRILYSLTPAEFERFLVTGRSTTGQLP
ncbi:hypothetical protein [Modestobacter lacusdianchii]